MKNYKYEKMSFNIIEIIADTKQYYPNYMEREDWMKNSWVKHQEMDIPLGKSRYGGPVIDLPPDVQIPDNMRFSGQLNLSEIGKYDLDNRLPKSGQLLFFSDLITDTGRVFYSQAKKEQLIRHIVEHDDHMFLGVLIQGFRSAQESMKDYYTELEEGDVECWECGKNILNCDCVFEGKQGHIDSLDLNEEGKKWGYFAGYDKSKMFGVYAHCQMSADERLDTMKEYRVLLQIGENGFNEDGIFNILIKEADLKNKNFDHCIVQWAQS